MAGMHVTTLSADSDSILLFYIFLSAGFTGITISLRPKGLPMIRRPQGFGDLFSFIIDWALIVSSLGIGPIYFVTGKYVVLVLFVAAPSLSSAMIGIFRINNQLRPSRRCSLWGQLPNSLPL